MLETVDITAILRRALASGGEFADIYYEESVSTAVAAEAGRIERVLNAADRGVGIRVISDFRTAYAWTNDLSPKALMELAETVARGVAGKAFDRDIVLSAQKRGAGFPVEIDPSGVPLADKIALVMRADAAARSRGERIRQVMALYRDARVKTQIANSEGDFVTTERTGTVFMTQAIAGDDTGIQTGVETAGESRGFEFFSRFDPEETGRKAADRAILMLGARKAPGGTMPVVLAAEAGGTMVHEAIGHGLEADLVQSGTSVYAGKLGAQVASPLVTVLDDATIPHARGSFSFDDEGSAAERTVLVENGILTGYLYDRLTAMKEGRASTGNGRRESYQTRPIVRMTNTLIAPGESDPAQVIAAADRGLLVRRMGGGQVNTVTGEFVFEVSEGYLLENGRIVEPVRGATLAGNGPEVLRKIAMVGNDLGFGIGTCGKDGQGVPVSDAQPTLLIESLTVGGAA